MSKAELENGPKRVLQFNSTKKLVAVFSSLTAAAKTLEVSPAAVHYACSGKRISCKGAYFRSLNDNIELEWEDLGALTLQEYDDLCGEKRAVYPTKRFARAGKRYNKNK